MTGGGTRNTTARAQELDHARVAAVWEAAPDAILVLDPDRRVVAINQRFCRLTGVRREDVVGTVPPFTWWPGSTREGLDGMLCGASGAGDDAFLTRLATPDGAVAVEGRCGAVVDDAGVVREHVLHLRRIAGHAGDAGHHDPAAHLTVALDAMTDGLVIQDAAGVVTVANPAACRLLGVSPGEIIGSHPDGASWNVRAGDGLAVIPAEHPGNERLVQVAPADGSAPRWLRVVCDAVRTEGGAPAGTVTMLLDTTEPHLRLQELQRERDFTHLVLGQMAEALLILGPGRRVLMVNDRFCLLTGFSRPQVIGLGPPFPWWPPDQVARLTEAHGDFGPEHAGRAEMDIVDVNGRVIPLEVSRTITVDADGTPQLYVLTGRDISARRAALLALHNSEERLRAAITATRDGMIVVGSDARVRSCNPAACDILGVSEPELLGADMGGLGHTVVDEHGVELPYGQRPMLVTLAGGAPQRGVTVGLTRPSDGRRIWVIESCEPLGAQDERGRADEVLVTLTDITGLHDARAALQHSEARYRALFGYHADAVIRLSLDAHVLSASQSVWRVLRFDPADLPRPSALVHPDELAGFMDVLARMTDGETGLSVCVRMRRGDDRWIWAEVTGGPVFDDAGRLTEIHISVRDVTEREQRERESGALHRIAEVVAAGAGAPVVFDAVARELAHVAAADAVEVSRFDGCLAHAEGTHPTVDPDAERAPVDLTDSPTAVAAVWRTHQPASLTLPEHGVLGDAAHGVGTRSTLAVPVRLDGAVWGALSARSLGYEFPDGTMDRMVRFADLASIAIASIRERAQLRSDADSDPLTGLANRRVFDRRLTRELRDRAELPTCLICIDLDDFKQVNDTHGHVEGDRVLMAVAEALRGSARADDLIARRGGDEFAWILPGTVVEVARARAGQLLRRVRAITGGPSGRVTVSVGVVQAAPGEGEEDLVRRADEELYAAKAGGGDRMCVGAGR